MTAKKPARKTLPDPPLGAADFDRDLARLIKEAEKRFSGDDWNWWTEVALHLERARTPLRAAMTKAERKRL
ncbi:hypothetical protein [Parvibaculum sp.]|uniref:hypothetical protein n=1 Tax=Parvibaculum sp. TaxID=2024848 RepID=UPI001D67413B|nr:hypothetical protein [Parvibaculum sp.]MBX3490850.1 hypothetical protein [Parvibaculum sp.]